MMEGLDMNKGASWIPQLGGGKWRAAGLAVVLVLAATGTIGGSAVDEGSTPPAHGPAGSVTATTAAPPALGPAGSAATAASGPLAAAAGDPQTAGLAAGFRYADCPAGTVFEPDVHKDSGFTQAEEPPRRPLENIRQISAGNFFDAAGYGNEFGSSYALAQDGSVYDWGFTTPLVRENRPAAFPQKVSGLTDPIKRVDGPFALTTGGDVYDLHAEGGPRKIQGLTGITVIAQSEPNSLYARQKNGTLLYYTMRGVADKPETIPLPGFGKVRKMAASPFIMLTIGEDNRLRAAPARFGSGPFNKPAIVKLPDGGRPLSVHATMSSSIKGYVLTSRGNWYFFNENGELKPATVLKGATQVTATESTQVALKSDGTVWVWGELTDLTGSADTRIPADKPVQVAGLANVVSLAAGSHHILALTKDGHVQSLGSNMYGQLGRLPVYAKDPAPMGVWRGVTALFTMYGKIFGIKDGDVWSLMSGGITKPVLLGQNAKKVAPALGNYAILTGEGRLLLAPPDQSASCKVLQTPTPVADMSASANGILLALTDGRVYEVGIPTVPTFPVKELRFAPQPAGKVTRVFGNPVPMTLTDKGELYYQERLQDGFPLMKPVQIGAPVKEWAPLYYIYSENAFLGKALDGNGRVYELRIKLPWGNTNVNQNSVDVKKTEETGERLSGGAVIGTDGSIREKIELGFIDTILPAGTKIRTEAYIYYYPIEGRSFFYHMLVTEDDTVYWLGDYPYSSRQLTPGDVRLP
jgi:hypothetical protein